MTLRRPVLLATLASVLALGTVGVTPALAAPLWHLDIRHDQTNFPPGGTAEYRFDTDNLGDTDSSGTTTLTVDLPAGLTRDSVRSEVGNGNGGGAAWSCPGPSGASHVVCTTTSVIHRHSIGRSLILTVDVASGLDGQDLTTTATLSGGGAPDAPPAAGCPPGVAACASEPTHISSLPAPFGILPDSLNADFYQADGVTPVRGSGAHPDNLTVAFDLASDYQGLNEAGEPQETPAGTIHNLEVDLPPGFLGNPTAVTECPPGAFLAHTCPASSQVGRADIVVYPISPASSMYYASAPVFNMSHPLGAVSDLAFNVAANPVHVKVSLDPSRNYAVRSTVDDVNESLPPFSSEVTIWGVPADSSHDSERCGDATVVTSASCPTDHPREPFLTAPFDCNADNAVELSRYDSWQNRGVFGPDLTYPMPGHVTGCDAPRFQPDVSVNPTGRQANTPTGLEVSIQVPQSENPDGLATPPVRSTVVTLPQGMTLSPSFADGLDGCTQAQIGLGTNDPVACPDNSRIGDVSLTTPLLPNPVLGSMYLAKQNDNPFATTFAIYMAVHDTEQRGALVKIPGKIELDQQTGQITTSFDNLPEIPFTDFTLSFRSGDRAPLVNPPDCGPHTIAVKIASYAQPDNLIDASNAYDVTEGPGGGPCPPDAAHRHFAPQLTAGTLNPVAGSYSSFLFRLTRADSDQEISQVQSILPPGLLAKIAGVPFCSEAAIAAIPTAEGTGASELADPHCPTASQIGTIATGVGSGAGPNYFNGKVYLAGPYKGAPLSLLTVVPALAGPFDLGNVVVRAALQVNPDTARVTAISDPFPTALHGILLRIRDIRLRIDRPETTLNPTNCDPLSVNGLATGVGGDLLSTADDSQAPLATPFQVGDCGRLGFKPKLFFKLKGGTHRGDHPAFFSRLIGRPGDANIGKAIVALPKSEFLENAHIGTVCTRVQFRADACPAASIYGHAKAITPLLDDPVEGDLVLRSSDNPLPDLVARLRGQISANLVGRIDSVNGGIRTSFETVPDVPVSEFTLTMLGGDKGLLVNSRNLCKAPARADVKFTSQSNKFLRLRPAMQTSCKGKAKRTKRRQHQRG